MEVYTRSTESTHDKAFDKMDGLKPIKLICMEIRSTLSSTRGCILRPSNAKPGRVPTRSASPLRRGPRRALAPARAPVQLLQDKSYTGSDETAILIEARLLVRLADPICGKRQATSNHMQGRSGRGATIEILPEFQSYDSLDKDRI